VTAGDKVPLPGMQFALSSKFLDTLCLEVTGPPGGRGPKGFDGEAGEDGHNDGPRGERGDPGRDATAAHDFTGIKFVELDTITDTAVVSMELDGAAGMLSYTKTKMNVPEDDEPADQFVAIPTQRSLYYPDLADDPTEYVTLDDWRISVPPGDPLYEEPELLLLRMQSDVKEGVPVPVESVQLSDFINSVVTHYKGLLVEFQDGWLAEMREYIEGKDGEARTILGSMAQKVAECEFDRPIQFCMGIGPNDCQEGEGGPYPPDPPESTPENDPSYVPPYVPPPPGGNIVPTTTGDPSPTPETPPTTFVPPVSPPSIDDTPDCPDAYSQLVIFITDEAIDCYVSNLCQQDDNDPDTPPEDTIVYDEDVRAWRSFMRTMETDQSTMLGLMQLPAQEFLGDERDLKYPGRALPDDTLNSPISHTIIEPQQISGSTVRFTSQDIIDFVSDILNVSVSSSTNDQCRAATIGDGTEVDSIIIQYDNDLGEDTARGEFEAAQVTNAAVILNRQLPNTCVEGRVGWASQDPAAPPANTKRWLYSSLKVAEYNMCNWCGAGNEPSNILILIAFDEAFPIYEAPRTFGPANAPAGSIQSIGIADSGRIQDRGNPANRILTFTQEHRIDYYLRDLGSWSGMLAAIEDSPVTVRMGLLTSGRDARSLTGGFGRPLPNDSEGPIVVQPGLSGWSNIDDRLIELYRTVTRDEQWIPDIVYIIIDGSGSLYARDAQGNMQTRVNSAASRMQGTVTVSYTQPSDRDTRTGVFRPGFSYGDVVDVPSLFPPGTPYNSQEGQTTVDPPPGTPSTLPGDTAFSTSGANVSSVKSTYITCVANVSTKWNGRQNTAKAQYDDCVDAAWVRRNDIYQPIVEEYDQKLQDLKEELCTNLPFPDIATDCDASFQNRYNELLNERRAEITVKADDPFNRDKASCASTYSDAINSGSASREADLERCREACIQAAGANAETLCPEYGITGENEIAFDISNTSEGITTWDGEGNPLVYRNGRWVRA